MTFPSKTIELRSVFPSGQILLGSLKKENIAKQRHPALKTMQITVRKIQVSMGSSRFRGSSVGAN